MAEPTNKSKTISFAGRNIDQNEFNRRARQKAAEWAQYQGLKGDEVADFNESLNDILAGISDGRYSVTETGALSGKGSSRANAYNSQTGQRVDDANGGNSRRRRGFDPDSNVMGYLNGIAGAMSTGSTSSTSSRSSSASAKTMQQYISDNIFGEGNNFSPEQLVRWADAYDAVGNDGKRGISGRRQWIADTLNEYRNKYNNGDFGEVSDEDKTKTNDLIDSIISNNNPDIDKDWQLSKNAPWLSHLLFRDAKYYSDDSERKADTDKAEQEARADAAEAYVSGVAGATNPYEKGSQEYNYLEQRRNENMDQTFLDEFKNHTWDYNDKKSFRTQVTEVDPNLFSSWNLENVRNYLAGAEGLETNEYGQDVHAGIWGGTEFGHNDWTGYGKDDTSLSGTGLMDYFKALPNDFKPDDTTLGFGINARSNKAILGKAAADYARSIIGTSGGAQYQLADGSYLLPQFIDWNSGKAYRFNLNGNKMTISTDNIGTILNSLTPGSPLQRLLYNEWRNYNKRPALTEEALNSMRFKEGGVIKAAKGAPLSEREIAILTGSNNGSSQEFKDPRYATDYQPLTTTRSNANEKQLAADQERYATALENGVNKQRREDYGNETVAGHFSGVDMARIAAAAMDIGSLGAAIFAGPGTAAAGILGVGSTATTLGADLADKGVSTGQALGGMAANLGLDLVSLIPGAGAGAGGWKVAKNLIKLTPKLIPVFATMATGPQAIETLKKINTDGFKSITKDELRNLSYCLSAITGAGTMGAAHVRRAKLRKGMPTETVATTKKFEYLNGEGKPVEAKDPEAVVKAVNAARRNGSEAAEKALQSATGDKKAKFIDQKFSDTPVMKWFNKKVEVENVPSRTPADADAKLKWLAEHRNADNEMRERMRSKNKVSKWMANNLATDFEIMTGSSGYLRNPFIAGRFGNNGKYAARIDADIKNTEAKVLEGLTPGKSEEFVPELGKTKATETLNKTSAAHEKAVGEESAAKKAVRETFKAMKLKGKFDDNVANFEGSHAEAQAAVDKINKLDKTIKEISKIDEASRTAAQKADLTAAMEARKVQEEIIRDRTSTIQADNYINALNAIRGYRKKQTSTAKYKKKLDALNTPIGTVESYLKLAGIKGATKNISDKKQENFKAFIKFMKDNKQNDTQIKEVLSNADLLAKARETFKFYKGGILKANVGVQIPALQKPTPQKSAPQTPAAPITGTLGNGSNGPLSGTLGGNSGVSGTLGTASPANPTNPTGSNIPGVVNPSVLPGAPGETGWGVNPTDLAITALESGKYGLTQGINGAIYNVYAGFRGFHETPLLKHYRQWSAKPLEDQMARNTAEYRRMGARAAAGTTDQNQAFAWQLAATDKAMAANAPLAIQANEQIKTTVDQQNAVGNENFANMHEVGERNRQGDVALSNARLKAWADYLHKFGTTATQNIMARQYGMAKAGIANDERAFQAALNTDPTVAALKARYEDVARRRAIDPQSVSDAEAREATINYREAASKFRDAWTATHITTTGTPYSGYGYTYKAPATFDFGSGFVGFARRGGKMEAAEREKTRREYEKIYHDSMKLLVTESNKKLRSGNAYAFYRKLFMHAK